jgi:hypothetical protein
MARLIVGRGCGLARIVRWGWHLGSRPFGEKREEARDVLGHLPGVLMTQIATEAALPDLTRAA